MTVERTADVPAEAMTGTSEEILVVGGGIAGITAALEAAETGARVYLVEKNPHLGGRVAQLARYFPKLCPPTCGLEIDFQRLRDNPDIRFFTQSEVEEVTGGPGRYRVKVRRQARYVNDRCTSCGLCVEVCPVDRPNPFDYGMSTTKAISLSHEMAFPMKHAIDGATCLFETCGKCVAVCPVEAIDLRAQPEIIELEVGAIIVATGWQPYDARAIANLAFEHHPDVITNVMFERMLADNGPTQGRLLRPSDGSPVQSVAFVQCAGSRDRLYLAYCSGICCLASLKEAQLLLERNPGAQATIFYIDLRTPGTYQAFAAKVLGQPNIRALKGKVADILPDADGARLIVVADDMIGGAMSRTPVDLVVLATGMVPSEDGESLAAPLVRDVDGFLAEGADDSGIYVAGCARAPMDVATATLDGTAAAMRALGTVRRMVASA
jgi:quinone-modifying oxidoreductase subunit QmoA